MKKPFFVKMHILTAFCQKCIYYKGFIWNFWQVLLEAGELMFGID